MTRWRASNLTTLGGSLIGALLGAIAVMGLVTAVTAFFLRRAGPAGLDTMAVFGALVTVGFGIATFVVGNRLRAVVSLVERDVESRGARETYRGPFRVHTGWIDEALGRGLAAPVVMLAIEDGEGRLVLYLREQLGAAYAPPESFPNRPVSVSGANHVLTNSLGLLHVDRLAAALVKPKG